MNDGPLDVRTPIAVSQSVRVEVGRDRTLHLLVGPVTLHLERHLCEELTTTLAVAMVRLREREERDEPPALRLVTPSEATRCSP